MMVADTAEAPIVKASITSNGVITPNDGRYALIASSRNVAMATHAVAVSTMMRVYDRRLPF